MFFDKQFFNQDGTIAKFVQVWEFDTFFRGHESVVMELHKTEEDVIEFLNANVGKDNWKQGTLKKTKKIKNRRAKLGA